MVSKQVIVVMSANTDPTLPPHSEYWKNVQCGFSNAARNYEQIDFKVIYPRGKYHDYEGVLEEAVSYEPDYIITAMTREKTVYNALKEFKNKIIAIDVPPNQNLLNKFGRQILGYVGINHKLLGKTAAEQLMSHGKSIDQCLVIGHDNYGHFLKYEAIVGTLGKYGIATGFVYLDDNPPKITLPPHVKNKNVGVIALSTKGVVAAENYVEPQNLKQLVGVDINEHIVELIETKRMLCTFVQQPEKIAAATANMILYEPESYQKVFIDTIVATEANARELLKKQKC